MLNPLDMLIQELILERGLGNSSEGEKLVEELRQDPHINSELLNPGHLRPELWAMLESYPFSGFWSEDLEAVFEYCASIISYLEAPTIPDNFQNHDERSGWEVELYRRFKESGFNFWGFYQRNRLKRSQISIPVISIGHLKEFVPEAFPVELSAELEVIHNVLNVDTEKSYGLLPFEDKIQFADQVSGLSEKVLLYFLSHNPSDVEVED